MNNKYVSDTIKKTARGGKKSGSVANVSDEKKANGDDSALA